MTSTKPDLLLANLRQVAALLQDTADAAKLRQVAKVAVVAIDALDAHLSAGGTPPEAWREGPDAPALDDVVTYTRAEIVNGTGWPLGLKFRQILPDGNPSQTTYTRAEIVNGTGWARSARFIR